VHTGQEHAERGVSRRLVELVVALALIGLGALVIVDSLRVGASWGDDGPQAGYFTFYIGCLLCLAGAWIFVHELMVERADPVFATLVQIRHVAFVLGPAIAYVALAAFLGIYVASAMFLAAFMHWQGRLRWALIAPIALGVPLAMFLLFERWFLVPLPKGPLEAWLGF
jgi:putative tricarboxylic transport membrane protein